MKPFAVRGRPNIWCPLPLWRLLREQPMTAAKLSKSISLPGLYKIGTDKPKSFSGNARKTTLGFKTAGNLKSAVDLKKTPATEHSRYLASLMKTGAWRTCYREEEEGPMLQETIATVHTYSRSTMIHTGQSEGNSR